jgi:hypothetical protein
MSEKGNAKWQMLFAPCIFLAALRGIIFIELHNMMNVEFLVSRKDEKETQSGKGCLRLCIFFSGFAWGFL